MSIIEKKFVQQVLQDEGQRFLRNQGRELRKKLHFHTHRIINERSAKVTTSDTMDGKLTISMVAYLRLLDSRRNTKRRGSKARDRKGYQIYNRFAMGHFYAIAQRLQTDFTEKVRTAIRREWSRERRTS